MSQTNFAKANLAWLLPCLGRGNLGMAMLKNGFASICLTVGVAGKLNQNHHTFYMWNLTNGYMKAGSNPNK